MMSKASNAAGLKLSLGRLAEVRPELAGQKTILCGMVDVTPSKVLERRVHGKSVRNWRRLLSQYLSDGQCAPAVVIRRDSDSFIVSAYSHDFDAVVMLRFPSSLELAHDLALGSRLLAVNTYVDMSYWLAEDITPGDQVFQGCRWGNFEPIIADFLSSQTDKLALAKRKIDPALWRRTETLGREYLQNRSGWVRDGRPGYAIHPRNEKGMSMDSRTVEAIKDSMHGPEDESGRVRLSTASTASSLTNVKM